MATAAALTSADALIEALVAALGPANVLVEEAERRFYSTDVYNHVELPAAVVRPGSVEEIQRVVRIAADAGAPVIVRGGGASYTDGYVHKTPGGITIDTSRLKRIEIDETNSYVTVEAGVTWAELHEALAKSGLRTPFWGPFSGLAATIGGSASQNSISHGTGAHGSSAENILSFDIVTGTGELLRTGSAGSQAGVPHYRSYGPDLTGLFCGDCGALGVKARITLPLIRRREAFETASFNFGSFEALHAAMRAVAIEGIDDENFGLDATLQQGQIGRNEGVAAKADIAVKVLKSSGGLAKGVKALAKMAAAGDRALKQSTYAVHYIVDGVDGAEARAKIALVKKLATAHGEEIPNTVPTVVRGMPFAPLTNTLGPKGERWVPMHGLLAHDRVVPFHQALGAYWESKRAAMDAHGIYSGAMFMTVRSTAFVYEPTYYWPDARTIFHERMVPADHLASVPTYPAASDAAKLVDELKHGVIDLMQAFGPAHLQIGKFYPYLPGRNAAAVALLRALKGELDPKGIMNPGALGL